MKSWKKLSEKTIYKNPWITLVEDEVIQPNGMPGTYAHVVIPTPSVAIVPIDEDGIYLIENYRYVIERFSLEIPCGASLPTESDLQESARRELKEETGFEAAVWDRAIRVFSLSFLCNDNITFFFARGLTAGTRHIDDNEIIKQPKKYRFDEIRKMIEEGRIVQTTSVAGILLALSFLKK